MAVNSPIPSGVPVREPADYRGTVRFTDWSGGYDQPRAQSFSGEAILSPTFWESQNMDTFSKPGTMQLCSKINRIGSVEGTDKEYLIYPFNAGVYRLPTANFAAADVQKIVTAIGAPAWGALTNIYPGANTPRGAVVWRDQWVVAGAENVVRVMSAAEVWSTIAAPTNVTAPILGMVGISQDDKLLAWWEGSANAGLYAWDGTNWGSASGVRLYPQSSTATVVTCDNITRGLGSTLLFLRDASGTTVLVEWVVLSTGSQFATPLAQQGLRVYPQGATIYGDSVWVAGKLQNQSNRGVLYKKDGVLNEPVEVAVSDTNYATDNQKGLDWSWRCLFAVGDVLWIGGSSRENHDGALYRLFFDPDSGEPSLMPTSTTAAVAGPIYSIAQLPPLATGATTTERLFMSSTLRTWYRDRDNGSDPTLDADSGFLQLPDVDLGVADHAKIGRFVEAFLAQKSTGGTVELQYRVDPQSPSVPWLSFGFCTHQGLNHIAVPDDNPALQNYGQTFRTLQLRIVMQRATSGVTRDVLDTVAYDVSQIRPLSSSS